MTREESQAEYHAQVLSILQERFQIKTHTETKEQPAYDLVMAKSGSKLRPHDPANGHEGSISRRNDLLRATGIRMKDLAKSIEGDAGRTIVDRTDLMGSYDIEMRWSREAQNPIATDNGSDERLPSLFMALEEQLGLKLIPARGAVTSLVVDAIQFPSLD